jgi:hypothetical protein
MKNIEKKIPKVATSWEEVPPVVESRPAEYHTVAYGISRALCGNEVMVDCGDKLGDLSVVKLEFRDNEKAWKAFCRGLRIEVKVVKHPEHQLE